jgi:hypothetical protein
MALSEQRPEGRAGQISPLAALSTKTFLVPAGNVASALDTGARGEGRKQAGAIR